MAEFSLRTVERTPTVGIRKHVKVEALPAFFSDSFGVLYQRLATLGINPMGPPFARYRGEPADVVDVEVGVPIAGGVEAGDQAEQGLVVDELPDGKAVETLYRGPYDQMESTYHAMAEWISDHDLQPAEEMWEYYLTDPDAEPDPAKWETRIVWPVAES